MLEVRLHTDPRHTQQLTSAVLAIHGLASAISGPVIGHFADKISNRKKPLLLSLVGCIVGTIMVAAATSLWILLVGRVLQGIAGSAVWIIGLSTAAERVGEENLGKVMGIANSFITAGSISGPMVSGLLFEALGYWPTWAAPLAVLVLDIIARLVMAERPKSCPKSPSPSSLSTSFDASEQERSPLLSEAQDSYQSLTNPPRDPEQADLSTSSGFYRAMLRNGRVLAALLTSMAVAVVIVGIDATLPLHVRDVFGWGPGQTGMMFLYLQVPSIVIGPFAGWARDRVGLRYPVSLSLAAFAGLMWLQGVPGNRRFPWASADSRGPTIYIASMLAIGTVTPFLAGIGILEVTGES
jgi:sugar phosphate permease